MVRLFNLPVPTRCTHANGAGAWQSVHSAEVRHGELSEHFWVCRPLHQMANRNFVVPEIAACHQSAPQFLRTKLDARGGICLRST